MDGRRVVWLVEGRRGMVWIEVVDTVKYITLSDCVEEGQSCWLEGPGVQRRLRSETEIPFGKRVFRLR
jgi:hypothetical protein